MNTSIRLAGLLLIILACTVSAFGQVEIDVMDLRDLNVSANVTSVKLKNFTGLQNVTVNGMYVGVIDSAGKTVALRAPTELITVSIDGVEILANNHPTGNVVAQAIIACQLSGNAVGFRKFIGTLSGGSGENRYLEQLMQTDAVNPNTNPRIGSSSGLGGSGYGSGGGIGVPTAPVVAGALTRVIARRFEEEVAIYAVHTIRHLFDETPALRLLFSRSYSLLVTYGEQYYHYNNFLSSLQQTLEEDLKNCATPVPEIIYTYAPDSLKSTVAPYLLFIDAFVQSGFKGFTFRDYVANLYASKFVDVSGTTGAMVKVLYGLTETLNYSDDIGVRPISSQDLKSLQRYGDNGLVAFVGVIFERNKSAWKEIRIAGVSVNDGINAQVSRVKNVANIIYATLGTINNVSEIMSDARADKADKAVAIIKQISDLFTQSYYTSLTGLGMKLDTAIPDYLHALTNIATGVREKKYGLVAAGLATIIDRSGLKDGKQIIRIIMVVADIVNAETSEDFEKILESYMLPAGSYGIKRASSFNISLNNYTGGCYSVISGERWQNNPMRTRAEFFSDIGVSFSVGGLDCPISSISVHGNLIDLGSLVAYRVRNDTTKLEDQLSTITWNDLYAPGLSLIFGIAKSPFALGIEGLWLTTVNTEDKKERVFTWRFGVMVDLPMFNLYTQPR